MPDFSAAYIYKQPRMCICKYKWAR